MKVWSLDWCLVWIYGCQGQVYEVSETSPFSPRTASWRWYFHAEQKGCYSTPSVTRISTDATEERSSVPPPRIRIATWTEGKLRGKSSHLPMSVPNAGNGAGYHTHTRGGGSLLLEEGLHRSGEERFSSQREFLETNINHLGWWVSGRIKWHSTAVLDISVTSPWCFLNCGSW